MALVDIVVIIGIFVLQFRTDSNIIEKLGELQVTLAKKDNVDNVDVEEGDTPVLLEDQFRVSYSGINLFSDSKNPVFAIGEDGEIHKLTLQSWEKLDDLSFVLNFSDDINISFELASAEPSASLAIITDFPETYSEISIPYSFTSNVEIESEESNHIVLNKRKEKWEVYASSLDSGKMNIKSGNFVATYSIYEEVQKFTFDSITSLPIADTEVFRQNFETFSDNLISAYKANTVENNLTEQIIVSYVAAMAEKGKFKEAIDSVPQAKKKSAQRTYLSAPYFNTLADMNVILNDAIDSYEEKIASSAANKSLDIFTIHNIADYMYINPSADDVTAILENAATVDASTLTLSQATGIIQVYVDLYNYKSDFANILSPIVEGCIDRISEACAYDGNVLTMSENDTFLSVIQAIETGIAVMRYGFASQNDVLVKAGCVIVNSYLGESASFDLRTLANLYPLLAFEDSYYPHFQKISGDGPKVLWAWTCAKDIAYSKDEAGTISITIDFPEGLTHYVIIKGLPRFNKIYIYNMSFRTDPRFETYNSSGYVYKDKRGTLLLKSRHKQQHEEVRFVY